MSSSASLSDLLGWVSIACWLGAQFPQVLENIRNQSCDGLALPFLLNWLLGDATNLLGCILTHQLPFQTYLATYFCFVDFSLLSQYFYYRSRTPYPPLLARSRAASSARPPLDRAHYRTLSTVAANVAAAAALAEHEYYGEDDDVDEAALARLADSFHSVRSDGARAGTKRVSWSRERGGSLSALRAPLPPTSPSGTLHHSLILAPPAPAEDAAGHGRGRSLSRAEEGEWAGPQRRSSKAGRRGAGMVFMGVWALAGVGMLGVGRAERASSGRGRVVARASIPGAEVAVPAAYVAHAGPRAGMDAPLAPPELVAAASAVAVQFVDAPGGEAFGAYAEPAPSLEFVIGRISAWMCTTLYLTSRLPQIWKNYVRKSVEGLSMYLFVFAFLGNFFYVASILTSPQLRLPPAQAAAFLRESIPYLLGSGGTLVFDITIVSQSFLYDPRRKRGRGSVRALPAEEAGLLAGAQDDAGVRRRVGAAADA